MAKDYKTFINGEEFTSFPGGSWNRIVDAAKWVDDHRTNTNNQKANSSGRQALVARFMNDTDADLESPYPIVSYKDPVQVIDDDKSIVYGKVAFKGVLPDSTISRFAVLKGPAGKNTVTNGVIQGLTWAKVDIKTVGDVTCGIKDEDTEKLTSGLAGALILYAEKDIVGEQWAIIDVGGNSLIKIFLTDTIDAAGWDATAGKLTPEKFTAKIAYLHEDGDGTYTYNKTDDEDEINGVSLYTTAVPVGNAMVRFAYLKNGELLLADCNDIDKIEEPTPP